MPTPDEILTIGVELDAKNALRQMHRLQADMKGELKAVAKSAEALGKVSQKAMADVIERTNDHLTQLDDLEHSYDKQATELNRFAGLIESLQKKQAAATGDAKKGFEEQIKMYKKQSSTLASRVALKLVTRASQNKARKDMAETFGKVVDDAGSIFGSFFNKDLKGTIESFAKGGGKVLGWGLSKAATHAFKKSTQLRDAGSGMMERGGARGGAGGAAMVGIGKALQGIGGMSAKIAPILNTVSKLGPILSTASTIVVSLIKLFIDAEAAAKEFQQELLASTSTAEFLGKSGKTAGDSFDDLKQTVRSVRDAAFDARQNLDWGIQAEDHNKVLNVLNQEGVSLKSIADQAKTAKKDVGGFAAELTHVSVAYSRAFGVPLQEINQMQAEMVTDLGQSLEQTKLSFASMTRAASDSGIASNKFFAIIRGVSSDLSLYNSRLEDAVKTLTLLGKVMSPKNAQKFMQTAQQALKGMGRTDLLKTALLGGPNSAKTLQRDLDRKAKNIGDDIQAASGKAFSREDLLTKPIDELLSGIGKEQQGAIREAVADLRMDTKSSKKGVFGKSMAMRNAGPAAGLQFMKDSLNIGGTGKLADRMGDIGTQMMAENQGISQEQLASMAKFEMALDDEREALKKGLKDNDPEVVARLQKAGLKSASEIDSAGYDQIYDALDNNKQTLLDENSKVIDYAKKQTELTSTMLKKLETLIQWFMNTFYNAILDIYEAILQGLSNIPGAIGDYAKGKLGKTNAQRAAQEGGGTAKAELMDAAQKGGSAVLDTKIAKNVRDTIFAGWKERKAGWTTGGIDEKMRDAAAKKETGESYLNAGQAWGQADDAFVKNMEETKKLLGTEQKMFSDMASHFSSEDWAKALKSAGIGDDVISEFTTKMAADPSLGASGVLSGMEIGGSIKDEKLMESFQNFFKTGPDGQPVVSDVSMERRTKALGAGSDILSQSGIYKPLEETSASSKTTAEATEQFAKDGHTDGTLYVRFSTAFLGGKYKKTMEEAVLEALRQGLFEFYMYSKLDPEAVAKFMGDEGMTATDFAKKVGEEAEAGRTPKDLTGLSYVETAQQNASGGVVAGVNGGLAMVRAAAGEGLASVGPGERIIPAGGGSGGSLTIPIHVDGIGGKDLARHLHVTVADAIAAYKRRERFA